MKNNLNILFSFFLFFILLFSITSCSDGVQKKSVSPTGDETTITEAPLPKGKQVIDDDNVEIKPATDQTVALGKDGQPNTHGDLSAVPVEDRAGFLKKKFKHLLVFHADDTMEVNAPRLATLILSKDGSIEKIKEEVLEESDARDNKIKTDTSMDFGSKMKARLIAFGSSSTENSFSIEPLGDDIQSFSSDRKKIIWQWKITPLKPGEQELKLSVQIIEKDGETVSLPARNIPVVIFSKPESFFSKASDFITRRYEFLITAIMIPIIIAWFTTRIKNKMPQYQQPKQPAETPPAQKSSGKRKK